MDKDAFIIVNEDGLVVEAGFSEHVYNARVKNLLGKGYTISAVTREESIVLYGETVRIKLEMDDG